MPYNQPPNIVAKLMEEESLAQEEVSKADGLLKLAKKRQAKQTAHLVLAAITGLILLLLFGRSLLLFVIIFLSVGFYVWSVQVNHSRKQHVISVPQAEMMTIQARSNLVKAQSKLNSALLEG